MASGGAAGAGDARQAVELARRLAGWGEDRGWRGTDPYEGLSTSRSLLAPLKRTPLGRRLLIQAVKRSPVDLRPMLGIQPKPDAASVAWAVSAFSRNGFLDPDLARARLAGALELLDALRCDAFEEPCWGYHFDFQSRVFFYASGEPNTIATAFAGHALLDAHEALDDPVLLDRARGVGRFFIRHVPLTEDGEGAFFGYLPQDRSPIHNASLLAASLLARLAARDRDDELAEAAGAAVRYSTARQRPDGSWPYGELPNLSWVDNFHTGYVLDALRRCADAGIEESAAQDAWTKGIAYYRRELFEADGAPKYYSNRLHPIDAQCVAQGIQTLSIAAQHDESLAGAPWSVFRFALRRMIGGDGIPLFQRRRLWANRAPHVRWVVAPTLLALTHLLAADPSAGAPPREPERVAA
ncbi:MAG: hypothetical protein ACRDK1_07865 [Solirubrobacterales bacterium]